MEGESLADFLSRAPMQSVVGMPLGDVQGFYLDIVLASGDASVRLTGTAFDLPDRTEAFLLTASDFNPEEWWTGPGGQPGWKAEDLLGTWTKFGKGRIWQGPRLVRYFVDPDDRQRGLPMQGPLDSAAAIEFGGEQGRRTDRLVLYATPEYPCAIELATTIERCDAILASLQEFAPQTARTTRVAGI
ncbi:MAG TPA: hypothetical protein VLD60_09320 [Nitrospira sp.]|nr:hypothetical protein [Nitrospira sp.]